MGAESDLNGLFFCIDFSCFSGTHVCPNSIFRYKPMLTLGKYAHSTPTVFWGGVREGKKGWVNPPLPRHWEGWLFLALYKSSDIYFNIYWALIYSSVR